MDKTEFSTKCKIKNVHTEHCCKNCGCKYGEDDDCPVVNKSLPQSYECGDNYVCEVIF